MSDPVILIENFFFCFMRFAGLMLLLPYVGSTNVPTKLKAFMAYLVALVCFLSLPTSAYVMVTSEVEIMIIGFKEIVVGAIMGFNVKFVIQVLQFAGQIVSTPMGLSIATAIDPSSGEHSSTLGQFNTTLGFFLFFVINGHHQAFILFQESFQIIPISELVIHPGKIEYFVKLFYDLYLVSLNLAMPILCAMILIQFSLGVIVRTMPKLNIFMIGIPIQIALGMVTYIITMPTLVKMVKGLFYKSFASLYTVLEFFSK
jgi:flagellar biosynthesis protein FliR